MDLSFFHELTVKKEKGTKDNKDYGKKTIFSLITIGTGTKLNFPISFDVHNVVSTSCLMIV